MYKKTPKEQKQIIEGGRKLAAILDDLALMVAPGISAFEIDEKAERLILKAGGVPAFKGYTTHHSETPFPTTICASLNEEIVHGIANKEKILKDGDIFSIDIGMQYKGLFTDTALTVPVGPISKKLQQLIAITHEALEIGIRAVKIGAPISDIGKAIEAYVAPKGYGIVRDLVGHGVGHAVHEDPPVPNYFDPALKQWTIESGVVIAIEPMITLGSHETVTADDGWAILSKDGSLSAHFEHTIVVTDKGPVVATRRPSETI